VEESGDSSVKSIGSMLHVETEGRKCWRNESIVRGQKGGWVEGNNGGMMQKGELHLACCFPFMECTTHIGTFRFNTYRRHLTYRTALRSCFPIICV
jgi:hypothetical protein